MWLSRDSKSGGGVRGRAAGSVPGETSACARPGWGLPTIFGFGESKQLRIQGIFAMSSTDEAQEDGLGPLGAPGPRPRIVFVSLSCLLNCLPAVPPDVLESSLFFFVRGLSVA